jgi:hypothetical protein
VPFEAELVLPLVDLPFALAVLEPALEDDEAAYYF